jgi:GNAT superfamily N-acetyltransferase
MGGIRGHVGPFRPPATELVEAKLADLPPDIVRDIYSRILKPAFRPEELMTFEELVSTYTGGGEDPSYVLLRTGAPVAVMLGEWYASHRVLLLAYLAVAEEIRGSGIGGQLMRSVLPHWYADTSGALVVAEVDDPRSWATDRRRGDPVARLRFYERHGARLLPLLYFQPSLRAGSPRVRGMFLLRLDHSARVPSDVLSEFLVEYFTICEGPSAIYDPEVAELLSNAGAVDLVADALEVRRWTNLPTHR